MKKLPEELKYTATHEWIKLEEENIARVGITDHAQALLGDIVFVELPALAKQTKQGEEICVLESVKAAADVYSPLSGEIIEANPTLSDAPDLVNSDSYGKGWLFRIKFSDPKELEKLLSAKNYEEKITVETH
ncbi:glycine cleavage system protein GcvH [Rickettsiella endosymbiont of Dermanyssus gallinae]|uniref:glycine cleavage system protein GcvH n=1 Tax=Rickettsiella endosymbiont of Dermanyssus gallinae TaxID=2856608 RepID=UPI001C52D83F|nr:glycine cleavage system protein GcvH [Rickettsiella endosymbiont of Dermanyssus gallinae]